MNRRTARTVCRMYGDVACIMCSCGIGHGPMLMVYDADTGEYTEAGDVCTARWASAGEDHLTGEVCGRPATREAADQPLCEHHYTRLVGWADNRERTLHEAAVERMRKIQAELIRLEAERIHASETAMARYSIVYFILRESDGIIKIGYSRSPRDRFNSLKGQYGPLRLLATRGGNNFHENALHDKFARFLAEGREWFRPEPLLLRHVIGVRMRHPVCAESSLPVADMAEIKAMARAASRKAKCV